MTPESYRIFRKRLGLTQADAAALIGVTPHAIANWERGRRALPDYAVNMLELAEALNDQQLETLLAERTRSRH